MNVQCSIALQNSNCFKEANSLLQCPARLAPVGKLLLSSADHPSQSDGGPAGGSEVAVVESGDGQGCHVGDVASVSIPSEENNFIQL